MDQKYEDEDLVDFLQTLDGSEVSVTDWEAKFIASNLDAIAFSDPQREIILKMIDQYGKKIGWT